MEQRVFNISFIILVEKFNKLIRSLINRKVLKLNSILNNFFKIIALVIIKDLTEIVSYYFANGIILNFFKKSIIIVLYKERKTIFS